MGKDPTLDSWRLRLPVYPMRLATRSSVKATVPSSMSENFQYRWSFPRRHHILYPDKCFRIRHREAEGCWHIFISWLQSSYRPSDVVRSMCCHHNHSYASGLRCIRDNWHSLRSRLPTMSPSTLHCLPHYLLWSLVAPYLRILYP